MSLENDEPTGNTDGIDADALLNSIESPSAEREAPTEGAPRPQAEPEAPQAPQPAAATAAQEFEFTWNGKPIKADRTKTLQWAQQGYDYAQKMAEFNKRNHEWETQRKQLEGAHAPYKAIDEYAKKNPEWWAHVTQSYQARTQGGTEPTASAASDLPDWAKSKLEKFDQFVTKAEQERAAQAEKQEDAALDSEVKSIREKYSNLDWDSPDETGFTLEQKVLDHAIKQGIKSFRTAFLDMKHDDLLKLHEERAKETLNKDIQKRTKAGIIGKTPTSQKPMRSAENVKNKSYNDLAREALEELGIA